MILFQGVGKRKKSLDSFLVLYYVSLRGENLNVFMYKFLRHENVDGGRNTKTTNNIFMIALVRTLRIM